MNGVTESAFIQLLIVNYLATCRGIVTSLIVCVCLLLLILVTKPLQRWEDNRHIQHKTIGSEDDDED